MELIKRYIYEIYKERSFTKAAQNLYISQPALSSAISKYEKSIGFLVFDRSKNPLRLTTEGKILLESIENIINIENLTAQRIAILSKQNNSEIAIGGSMSTAYYLIPKICAAFHKEYPSVLIKVDLGNTSTYSDFQNKLQDGTLDLVVDYVPFMDSSHITLLSKESVRGT